MTISSLSENKPADHYSSRVLGVRIRHAEWSFYLAWGMTAGSALSTLVGAGLLLMGKVEAGTLTTLGSTTSGIVCRRLAKDANDRLDRLAAELDEEHSLSKTN